MATARQQCKRNVAAVKQQFGSLAAPHGNNQVAAVQQQFSTCLAAAWQPTANPAAV